jgi:hypothetical protein
MRDLTAAALIGAALALAPAPNPVSAGPVNPDISVIGDMRATWSDASEDDEPDLSLHEVELALVGPLNPYASAEVYLGIHGTEGIEVEEAKLLLDRYFPGGFGLTAGQFLLDFGQLNRIHAHAYPFVDRPLMHAEFFGEDGLRDASARLDWLAPTDAVALRASAGAVRGDVLMGGHSHEHGTEEEAEEEEPKLGYTGRLELFAEPSPSFSCLVGASALHGTFDPHEDAKATWIDVDAKASVDLGPNRKLVLNAEGVLGSRDATEEGPAADPNGFFASADLRASKRWNLGGFVESATEPDDDDVRTMRWGGFAGLALLEETTLFRVVGRLTDPEVGDDVGEVLLQAIFALGPHRPHRY